MTKSKGCKQLCDAEIHAAWNDLLKAWAFPVVHELGLKEPARFNELKKRLGIISATSLTERLTELEQRKIVERRVYPETPPRVEYSLTQKGWELHALILELAEWVDRWHRKQPIVLETPKPQRRNGRRAASTTTSLVRREGASFL